MMKFFSKLIASMLLVGLAGTASAQPGGVGSMRLWLKANTGTTLNPTVEVPRESGLQACRVQRC